MRDWFKHSSNEEPSLRLPWAKQLAWRWRKRNSSWSCHEDSPTVGRGKKIFGGRALPTVDSARMSFGQELVLLMYMRDVESMVGSPKVFWSFNRDWIGLAALKEMVFNPSSNAILFTTPQNWVPRLIIASSLKYFNGSQRFSKRGWGQVLPASTSIATAYLFVVLYFSLLYLHFLFFVLFY